MQNLLLPPLRPLLSSSSRRRSRRKRRRQVHTLCIFLLVRALSGTLWVCGIFIACGAGKGDWWLQPEGTLYKPGTKKETLTWQPGDYVWVQWPGVHDRQKRVYVGTIPRTQRGAVSWAVLAREGNPCEGKRSDVDPYLLFSLPSLVFVCVEGERIRDTHHLAYNV